MKPLAVLRTEPAAVYVTALGSIAALIVAFGHLNATQAGALSTAATATGAAITATLARPANVAVISGAAAAILQALVIFRVPLSHAEAAAVVQVVSLVLGVIAMRPNLTPVVSLRAPGTHASSR